MITPDLNTYSLHAIERAWERYRLSLTSIDMAAILAACKSGAAPLMRVEPHARIFLWTYRRQRIVPVMQADRDFIVTFFPEDYFQAGQGHAFNARVGRLKLHFPTRKHVQGREYQRVKSNRHAFNDLIEEGADE